MRIADFGEAIQLDERESQQDNAPRGTEAFMAPEVWTKGNFIITLLIVLK